MALLAAAAVVSRAGIDVTGVAASAGGDSFVNDGKTHVHINNGGAAPVTVTFAIQSTVDGIAVGSGKQVVVPAGKTLIVGPFPPGIYNDNSNRVQMTYSAVTSVLVAVLAQQG